jgi:predicted methyltransferase
MPSREKLRGLFMIAMFREQSLHFVARRCLRTFSVLILSLFAIVGCSESEKDAVQKASAAEIDQPSVGVAAAVLDANLATVVAGSHRTPANVERDKYRRPVKVLEFFGIRPDMTVVEMWAEGGWWTEILAPYLRDEGTFYIADMPVQRWRDVMTKKLESNPDIYGKAILTQFGGGSIDIAPEGSADMILTFRNLHNWLKAGNGKLAFEIMYTTLKPGGILGVVEHRGSPGKPQDPQVLSGYVREDYAIAMAEKAGFKFMGKSEMNTNPNDNKDYPEGVWMLPPGYYTVENDVDRAKYQAIGESDRFTLKFQKPAQ